MQDISAMRRKDNKMDNEKKMPLNDLIRSTMDKVHEMADTNTIVGQPISTADGVTLIPISKVCLLYTSPSPRDGLLSRMPSSA